MENENQPTESVLSLVSQSVTTVTNLARTLSIRTTLAKDNELWRISARMIVSMKLLSVYFFILFRHGSSVSPRELFFRGPWKITLMQSLCF